MTAGYGVVHSEMPSDELMKKGGRMEGFQLWVNLPAKVSLLILYIFKFLVLKIILCFMEIITIG